MPQPAFSVSPASCTLFRMSSIESRMVPDTVQLMVEVAGLCASAPAFDMMRPAGIAPLRSAQRKRSYSASRCAGSSTSARVFATRESVSSIVASIGVPSLAVNRYFRSHMSSDASWNGISSTSLCSILTAVLIFSALPPRPGRPTKSPEKSHPGMRIRAPPASNFTWLPDSSAGLTRPSAGDHKILCQGCEIISRGRCCQGFPYGKIP